MSPKTREPLKPNVLIPNRNLKRRMQGHEADVDDMLIASLERRAKSRITVSSLPDRARVGVIAVEMGSAPSSAASVQLRV